MADFQWVPDNGASINVEFKVRRAQFGDGYSQRVGDGINTEGNKLPLTFTRNPATVQAIDNFLRQRKGTAVFTFELPRSGQVIKVVCPKWSVSHPNAYESRLTCEFERVYE